MNQWLIVFLLVFPPFAYIGLSGKPLTFLGIRKDGLAREMCLGAAVGILVGASAIAAAEALEILGISDLEPVGEFIRQQGLLNMAALTFFFSILEEIFFRGFLQGVLFMLSTRNFEKPVIQWSLAIVPTAAVFGLAHAGYGSVTQIVATFIIGLVFGFIYQKRQNIACPIALHIVFNWVNLAYFSLFEM